MDEKIVVGKFVVGITRKKMKSVTLRVKDGGEVCVSAPRFVGTKQIAKFVESKIDWLSKQVEIAKQNVEKNQLKNGSTIFVFGKPFTLQIQQGAKRNKVVQDGNVAIMFLKPNANVQKFFDAWRKKNLKKILPQFFERWCKITGLTVNGFSIRDMKTRWGSCNTRAHTISINIQVFHKPLECLDYLVLHEIAHIYEPSHNKRFKDFLTKYMPDWKTKRKLLKK